MIRDPRTEPKKDTPKTFAPEMVGGTGNVKAKPKWSLAGVGQVDAWTKSEARALFKKKLGVERLPIGSKVHKVLIVGLLLCSLQPRAQQHERTNWHVSHSLMRLARVAFYGDA